RPAVERVARRLHPHGNRLGPRCRGIRLVGPPVACPCLLARQPVAHRVLVHAELPRDRAVTHPPLVEHLDRHHFLPSQPALHPRPPPRRSDRSTSTGGAQKFVSSYARGSLSSDTAR